MRVRGVTLKGAFQRRTTVYSAIGAPTKAGQKSNGDNAA
jgi:hypothetical protein